MKIKVLATYGFINSIYEMEYFYNKFMEKYIKEQKNHRGLNELNFLLSAFLNKYQTLKDIYPRIGEEKTWQKLNAGKIERKFLKSIRNIFTHQGDMLINSYVNGEFYIGGPVYYINEYEKIKEIKIQKEPVNKLVKIFFKGLVEEIIIEIEQNKINLEFEIEDKEIKEIILKSALIPDFGKGITETIQNFPKDSRDKKGEFVDYLKKLSKNI